ncbi:hypothetical protein BDV95DRAFT_668523 [Massariosphaeria phaeospora]|uniref:Uncharacterized protein n=1 Tax=Massariosphaeria phaeospora TaxID=100035 RepID=A0A7C8M7W0_9PLEO|nr:hypothetical protein BDV95DRAFT_668523 [Massariosphaeria phaeospora]
MVDVGGESNLSLSRGCRPVRLETRHSQQGVLSSPVSSSLLQPFSCTIVSNPRPRMCFLDTKPSYSTRTEWRFCNDTEYEEQLPVRVCNTNRQPYQRAVAYPRQPYYPRNNYYGAQRQIAYHNNGGYNNYGRQYQHQHMGGQLVRRDALVRPMHYSNGVVIPQAAYPYACAQPATTTYTIANSRANVPAHSHNHNHSYVSSRQGTMLSSREEHQLENRRVATERGAYNPRRIKPADARADDPFWCRERNGEWHLRSFYQIENECYPGRWQMDAEQGYLVFHRQ